MEVLSGFVIMSRYRKTIRDASILKDYNWESCVFSIPIGPIRSCKNRIIKKTFIMLINQFCVAPIYVGGQEELYVWIYINSEVTHGNM